MKYKILHNNSKIIIIVCIFTISGLLSFYLNSIGCHKKGKCTGVEIDTTTILNVWLYSWGTHAALRSDHPPDPDSVNVQKTWNGNCITLQYKYLLLNELYLGDNTNNSYGTTYTITLLSNLGNAEGTITFPEMAHFTYPSECDTLPIGDVTVSWTNCEGANIYDLYKEIRAFDSTGSFMEFVEFSDTILNDTSITIPSSKFAVVGAVYYKVHLFILPYSGAFPDLDGHGNMSGTICGYLSAGGDGDIMHFYVGTPISTTNHYLKGENSLR